MLLATLPCKNGSMRKSIILLPVCPVLAHVCSFPKLDHYLSDYKRFLRKLYPDRELSESISLDELRVKLENVATRALLFMIRINILFRNW